MTRTPERLAQLLASVNPETVGEHVAGLCHEAAGQILGRVIPAPKEYVLGFVRDGGRMILLLRKNRPEWQVGKLNGVGGKVEPGEQPFAAMDREWAEETGGAQLPSWRLFARMIWPQAIVHCFAADVDRILTIDDVNDVGEEFVITDLAEVLSSARDEVIPNLLWLLPLAFIDPDRPVVEARG